MVNTSKAPQQSSTPAEQHTAPRFTREDFLSMSPAQVADYWCARQRAERTAGREHYTRLVEPETGTVVATIDGARTIKTRTR